MDNQFKKGIKQLREIKMTAQEKQDVLMRIANKTNSFSPISLQKIWTIRLQSLLYESYTRSIIVGALVVALIFTTSTAGVWAETSLPGDLLYPLKVNVTEPIRDLLTVGNKAKAEWNLEKAQRRVREFEALSLESKIDSQKEAQISALLNKHIKAFKDDVINLKKDERNDQAEEANVDLEATLDAHARVIDTVISDTKKPGKELNDKFAKDIRQKADEVGDADTAAKHEKVIVQNDESKKQLQKQIEKSSAHEAKLNVKENKIFKEETEKIGRRKGK